jgi:hypothetical protein
MDIDLNKVENIKFGEIKEYSDGRFYRELEIVRNGEIIIITLSGEEDVLTFKL